MQLVATSRYIHFGAELRYLLDAKAGWPVHGEGYILDVMDTLLGYLKEFDLPVTRRLAQQLTPIREELAESPDDRRLAADEEVKLREVMRNLESTLIAEASGNFAFIVVDKRIDVDKLLYDVSALMAPGVFDALPDIARYDFVEAGRCIAFERSTAAAFHVLRGTEAVLREFYCSIVRQKRVQLMWGPMVASLKQRRKKPPPKPLLDNLDNIRLSFRNPTQHPEKIYDIQEVQDLFSLCVDVLNRMVSFMHQ